MKPFWIKFHLKEYKFRGFGLKEFEIIFNGCLHFFSGMSSVNSCYFSPIPSRDTSSNCWLNFFSKKYILLCGICGGLCFSIGILYLAIFFILKNFTTSMQYFQTLPIYIPSVVVSALSSS